jgi:hypothetical protein
MVSQLIQRKSWSLGDISIPTLWFLAFHPRRTLLSAHHSRSLGFRHGTGLTGDTACGLHLRQLHLLLESLKCLVASHTCCFSGSCAQGRPPCKSKHTAVTHQQRTIDEKGLLYQYKRTSISGTKKSPDYLPAETLFPAKGCQIAWKSQVK